MYKDRRTVLATTVGILTAGCMGGGGGTPTPTQSPTPESCDPADVSRPPVVRDSNHPPQDYGSKPASLTDQSVADYLGSFELAFAWNRILGENDSVRSLGIETGDGYRPERAGAGYLASNRMRLEYAVGEDDESTEDEYVASYYVSAGPVYRVETDSEPVDPRTRSDRDLVQCSPE